MVEWWKHKTIQRLWCSASIHPCLPEGSCLNAHLRARIHLAHEYSKWVMVVLVLHSFSVDSHSKVYLWVHERLQGQSMLVVQVVLHFCAEGFLKSLFSGICSTSSVVYKWSCLVFLHCASCLCWPCKAPTDLYIVNLHSTCTTLWIKQRNNLVPCVVHNWSKMARYSLHMQMSSHSENTEEDPKKAGNWLCKYEKILGMNVNIR